MDAELLRIALISVVAGTALFSVILGAVLAFHWEKYAMNQTVTLIAIVVYGTVTVLLLALLYSYLPTA